METLKELGLFCREENQRKGGGEAGKRQVDSFHIFSKEREKKGVVGWMGRTSKQGV